MTLTPMKALWRLCVRLVLVCVVLLATAVAGLYIFVQMGDVRGYVTQIVTPYAPHLKLDGPITLGVWPSLHLDAHNVSHAPYKMERLRLHLPLIPLIRFALWRTPQKDMKMDVQGFVAPGVDPVNADMACASEGEAFDCNVTATMKAWKTQLNVVYGSKETHIKGDVHYTNNTIHVVESTLNNNTLAFRGRIMLVGRTPVVVGTPKPIDVHYDKNTLILTAPVLGLPSIELQNLQLKVKHINQTVEILQLEADAWHGHISTTGRIAWPQVTLKGSAHGIALGDIKELKEFVEKGTGAFEWHVTCDGMHALESLSGNTHIKLDPIVAKGVDLAHLRQAVQGLSKISLTDIAGLKDKLIKPGLMTLKCDMPIIWNKGTASLQKGRAEAPEIQTTLSGQFTAQQAINIKAIVEGLPAWPPLTVHIKGPWSQLQYAPDWEDLVKRLMQQALKSATQNIKKTVQDGLKKAIQGDAASPEGGIGQTIQKEAGKLLGGLFGKRS